jgi:hypothetical protein
MQIGRQLVRLLVAIAVVCAAGALSVARPLAAFAWDQVGVPADGACPDVLVIGAL